MNLQIYITKHHIQLFIFYLFFFFPLQVVAGIRAACGTALVIVNELLTFEKLAAGMFT
jgi:hypothetical protein